MYTTVGKKLPLQMRKTTARTLLITPDLRPKKVETLPPSKAVARNLEEEVDVEWP